MKNLEISNRKSAIENRQSKTGLLAVLIIAVCGVVLITHWPALSAKALSFDDGQYMTKNLLVQNPSWASAKQFLTEILEPSTVEGYYQPLAMISLMFDYSLGGRENNLIPFHRTSLALHIANTALMIVLLYLLFGQVWVAALAGLIFGVHPMTVEPIPWVGERKTLLAAFFSLWSLVLYVYSQAASNKQRTTKLVYIGSFVAYLLALMSKPTSTPIPAVMLLLDYWPLKRLSVKTVFEKLPFFVLGGISAVITYISQNRAAGTVSPMELGFSKVPLIVCYSIVFYLSKVFCPVNLSSHYAFPDPLALSNPNVLAGVIGTCVLILLLLISLRWTRGALTGWLIFFVTISPTMQVLRFSDVVAADKFAYLPSTGLLIAIASFLIWFCSIGGAAKFALRRVMVIIGLVLALTEAAATRKYLEYWQESARLFEHMLSLTPNSPIVLYNFANVLSEQNKLNDAIDFYQRALKIRPDYADARNNLGTAFELEGRIDDAINCYRQALQLKPDSSVICYNLGHIHQSTGKLDEAVNYYRQAIQLKPDYLDAQNNLGICLQSQRKYNRAIEQFHRVLKINPRFADAYNNIGVTLGMQNKFDEAVKYFRQALEIRPDFVEAHCNLGNAFELQGKLDEAVSQFQQALQIKPDFIEAHNNLGNVLAKQRKFDRAFSHFRQAFQLKPDWIVPLNRMVIILTEHPELKARYANEVVALAEHIAELSKYQDAVVLDILASAYAAAGQFDQAIKTAETALSLASAVKNDQLTAQIRIHLELYKQQGKGKK
jgi:tetratricopeptide (TPR) repeat protein